MPAEVGLPWTGFAPVGATLLWSLEKLVTAEPQGAASPVHAGGRSKSNLRIWRRILLSQLFSPQHFCWQDQPWWEITMGFCLYSCSRTWWFGSLNYCWFSDVPLGAVRGTMWHGMRWHWTVWDTMGWCGTPSWALQEPSSYNEICAIELSKSWLKPNTHMPENTLSYFFHYK